MWDFDSESEKVQDIQSDYLAALWNAGVRGFRMDAVKHIHTDSMKAIKEKFAKKIGVNADSIYWIQEVIGNSSEAAGIQPSNYVQNGTVTEFGFKSEMNQTFKDKIANLKGLNERLSKDLASEDANVFVTNWDTARNEGALTYKDGAKYQLANAFMLAYDYGTPRLLSDYKWDENDNGAPGATATSVPDVNMDEVCSTNSSDWNCEQRWTSTRGMIAFRNYVNGTKVADWQDDGGDNIAFSRGDKLHRHQQRQDRQGRLLHDIARRRRILQRVRHHGLLPDCKRQERQDRDHGTGAFRHRTVCRRHQGQPPGIQRGQRPVRS